MVDSCEIRTKPTVGPLDPVTGKRAETPGALLYSGKCKVQTYEAHEQTPQSGQHVYTVQRYYVHVRATVDVPVDARVTITGSVLDPNLVGKTYRVAGGLHKSMATANRLLVDEVTG
jgi:hypothetical protein